MALEFVGDAISLSGLTGSKLKSAVIGEYYPFWWSITSGGQRADFAYPTAIVELDAASGEMHIRDTGETILGSAGHALDLKSKNRHTGNLKVVLVEKNDECYCRLKSVIRRRWPSVDIPAAEGPVRANASGVYLLNVSLDKALDAIGRIQLGNSLFFFDPLRNVDYQTLEQVASKRIPTFYRKGTEFILFVFTSDWFLGRDSFAGFPSTIDQNQWSSQEKETISEADAMFGDPHWQGDLLTSRHIEEKEALLIENYRRRLHRWFRYVLPLPFAPKTNQLYNLILCSNYEAGVRATRDFYVQKTGNPKYSPNNRSALERFRRMHPEVFVGLSGAQRPSEWRILWKIITQHEEGICDYQCSDFEEVERNPEIRKSLLSWLERKGYLAAFSINYAWNIKVDTYRLEWTTVKANLDVDPPPALKPLSP